MSRRLHRLAVLLGLAAMAPVAGAMQSLHGPTFANSSGMAVDLSIVFDGKVEPVLRAAAGHNMFSMSDEVHVQSIVVTAGGRRYELDKDDYAAQSAGRPQGRQVWIFDGERICVRDLAVLKGRSGALPDCASSPALH